MTGRSCQSCKHFEPSAIWRKGWCRNPRLYAPQESHVVDAASLDCSRGLGSAWEAAETETPRSSRQAEQPQRRPLVLFPVAPQLELAGAGGFAGPGGFIARASGRGSSGGGDAPGPARPERSANPVGQERLVSFQPEERYWTDYLRIALPVIGLLILIALLWYWASALIGGPSGSEPTPITTPFTEVAPTAAAPASPVPSPTPTAPAITPTPGVPPTAPAVTNPTVAPQPTPAPDGAATGGNTLPECQNRPNFDPGTTVITSDEVNFRTEATSESPAIAVLPAGTELQTIGAFVDLPDCDWWPVTNPATGENGYIREDFLEAAGQ